MDQSLRLTSMFLAGSLFYLWREKIAYTQRGAFFAVGGLCLYLCIPSVAEAGVALFGGYLIFGFIAPTRGIFARINNRNDVSYGLYLYAWPIEQLLMWFLPALSLLAYGSLTLGLAYLAGWASWLVVEKPMLKHFAGKSGVARSRPSQPSAMSS